jgi:hypothetical protein
VPAFQFYEFETLADTVWEFREIPSKMRSNTPRS